MRPTRRTAEVVGCMSLEEGQEDRGINGGAPRSGEGRLCRESLLTLWKAPDAYREGQGRVVFFPAPEDQTRSFEQGPLGGRVSGGYPHQLETKPCPKHCFLERSCWARFALTVSHPHGYKPSSLWRRWAVLSLPRAGVPCVTPAANFTCLVTRKVSPSSWES